MKFYQRLIQAKKDLKLNNEDIGKIIGKSGDATRKAINRESLTDLEIVAIQKKLNLGHFSVEDVETDKPTQEKTEETVSGFEDIVAKKVLDRFQPAIEKILESHQNSKDATNRLSILISMLMDKVEELEEKIDRIEKNQSTILDKVS